MSKVCPCGNNLNYADCCERFINGTSIPATPEELMRSRYTAYTLANVDYIKDTVREPASMGFNAADAKQWAGAAQWQGLTCSSL